MGRGSEIEEAVRRRDLALAEERPAHLQHQLVVVFKAELENPLERAHGAGSVAQLEQRLAQAGQAVFMVRIQTQGVLEAPPSPGVLFPGQVGIGPSDMQFDRVWVEGDAFLEDQQRFIVPAFVVELMGLFVEVVGA
jgi:hypothetical protein